MLDPACCSRPLYALKVRLTFKNSDIHFCKLSYLYLFSVKIYKSQIIQISLKLYCDILLDVVKFR
jgi:hypothetical protein